MQIFNRGLRCIDEIGPKRSIEIEDEKRGKKLIEDYPFDLILTPNSKENEKVKQENEALKKEIEELKQEKVEALPELQEKSSYKKRSTKRKK